MVDKLIICHNNPLCQSPHFFNASDTLLEGRKVTWIKDTNGNATTCTIKEIADQLENVDVDLDSTEDLANLLCNLQALEQKIQNYNREIEDNGFYNILDIVFENMTFGMIRVKHHSISDKLINIEEKFQQSLQTNLDASISLFNKFSNRNLFYRYPDISKSFTKSLLEHKDFNEAKLIDFLRNTHLDSTYKEPFQLRLSELTIARVQEAIATHEKIDLSVLDSLARNADFFRKLPEPFETFETAVHEWALNLVQEEENINKIFQLSDHRLLPLKTRPIINNKLNALIMKRAEKELEDLPENFHKSLQTGPMEAISLLFESQRILKIDPRFSEVANSLAKELVEREDLTEEALKLLNECFFLSEEIKYFCESKLRDLSLKREEATLNKIKEFISKYEQGEISGIGTVSKRDARVIKFKQVEGHNIAYNKDSKEIFVDHGFLGKGSFKIVKKKLALFTADMLAVGKQQLTSEREKKLAAKEVKIMKKLKDKPHILQLHSASVYRSSKKGDVQLTITEFCNMGELKGHMKTLTDKQKLKVASDIIKGLIVVHENGVIHRDIKPANILLKKSFTEEGEEVIEAVVGDFGLSCFVEGDSDRGKIMGTKHYMPKEVFHAREQASFASDAWSVGILFKELFRADGYDNQPVDNESVKYVISGLLQSTSSERMTLPDALAILSKLS
jgi:tetratricopeptide (TPR) repeat protein